MATAMRDEFGDALDLKIFTIDSEEATVYEIKASTTVFLNGEWVPLDIATSRDQMEEFLKGKV